MKKVMTKEEFKEYSEARRGLVKYRICHVEDGKKAVDLEFDAKSDFDALEKLEAFKKEHPDGKEYFWNYAHEYILARDDGMYEISESLIEDIEDIELDDTARPIGAEKKGNELVHGDFMEFVKTYDYSRGRPGVYIPDEDGIIEDPYEDERRAYNDLAYLVKNYDHDTGRSHSRCESWSLDSHLLDDLAHNVPLIIEDKYGVPTPFCYDARKALGTKPEDGDEYGFSEKEMEKGKELWNAKLQELLDHVWLYWLYSGYGIIDEDTGDACITFQKAHIKDIPYKKGSYKEIDYQRLNDMTQAEWKAIWEWISEWGQSLWT